jgi:hypothetical protein
MINSYDLIEIWNEVIQLHAYGDKPLTVGWYKNRAFVKIWDFRKGEFIWKRFPNRDGQEPKNPPKWNPFERDSIFYNKMIRGRW